MCVLTGVGSELRERNVVVGVVLSCKALLLEEFLPTPPELGKALFL